MKQIGRRIFYDKETGKVLKVIGERQGYVRETTFEEDYPFYDPNTMRVIQLTFGERAEEFNNMGSLEVNPATEELIIYPCLTLVADKQTIIPNGVDTATIIASVDGYDITKTVYFSVNEGIENPITPENGVAVFQLAAELSGEYVIQARSEKFGTNNVRVVAESA